MELSFPVDVDAKLMLAQFYTPIHIRESHTELKFQPLNCARALDHSLVLRAVLRNYGDKDASFGALSTLQGESGSEPIVSLPSPDLLFKPVWNIIPDFIKDKIRIWAKANQEGPIAQEINEFVKQALRTLPIPIPGIFVEAAANLLIPPLVRFIIDELSKKDGHEVSSS